MSNKNIMTKLLLRRDTSTNLNSIVPALGEPVFSTDTNELKIGDGSTTWANLPTVSSSKEDKANKTTTISSASTNTQYPSAKAVYTELQKKSNATNLENSSSYGVKLANALNTKVTGQYAVGLGLGVTATQQSSFAEGMATSALGQAAHSEGENTLAIGQDSHAEGNGGFLGGTITLSSRVSASQEGRYYIYTYSYSRSSIMLGTGILELAYTGGTVVYAVITSIDTTNKQITFFCTDSIPTTPPSSPCAIYNGAAVGTSSHAEGTRTVAYNMASHAEGMDTQAAGQGAHAEGMNTQAAGACAHAEGYGTIAKYDFQHVSGEYNNNKETTLFEVGNGTSNSARNNAFEVYKDGHAEVGLMGSTDTSVVTKKYVDDKIPELTLTPTGVDEHELPYGSLTDEQIAILSEKPAQIKVSMAGGTPTIIAFISEAGDDPETEVGYGAIASNSSILMNFKLIEKTWSINITVLAPESEVQEASASINYILQRLSEKQNTLVSGTNIKTINNQSILGAGNIQIERLAETTYANLVNLKINSNLVPGAYYRITDYTTTTAQAETQSAGHQFDVVVLALESNKLSEQAYAMLHDGDTYFANSKLEAWQLWYCLDNDTARFGWADTTNGKGVIYRMIDEFENDIPYDFKNVQFKRYKVSAGTSAVTDFDGKYYGCKNLSSSLVSPQGYTISDATDFIWCYTFNGFDSESNSIDMSIEGNLIPNSEAYVVGCYKNVLGPCSEYALHPATKSSKTCFMLSNNVFQIYDYSVSTAFRGCYSNTLDSNVYYNTFGATVYNNTIGSDFYSNAISNYFYYNIIATKVYSNVIGSEFYYNTIGSSSYNNTIGSQFSSNTIISYFQRNTIGSQCRKNIIGIDFVNNIIGSEFQNNAIDPNFSSNNIGSSFKHNTIDCYFMGNTIGYGFNYNTTGPYFYHNTIGNYFHDNTFGSNVSENTIAAFFYDNTFGSNFSNNILGSSASEYFYAHYCKFDNGIQYISFTAEGASSGRYVQNVHIHLGVKGASTSNRKIVTISDRALPYETNVYMDENGNLEYVKNSGIISAINSNY